jgi:hypothetical protein
MRGEIHEGYINYLKKRLDRFSNQAKAKAKPTQTRMKLTGLTSYDILVPSYHN